MTETHAEQMELSIVSFDFEVFDVSMKNDGMERCLRCRRDD
jgi:hypothetical protein